MSFLDHLEELRSTLIRCLLCYAVGFLAALPSIPYVIHFLMGPLSGQEAVVLQSIRVAGAFTIAMKTAGITGLLLSAPALVYLLGRFIFPGLQPRERKAFLTAAAFASLLFIAGVMIGYRTTLRVALVLMLSVHEWLHIVPGWTADSYISFCLSLLLSFGLVFQLPVIILTLGWMGILNSSRLRTVRPHVIVALFILAMLLTPPDVFTQLMMAIPLVLLYEVCIWILYALERKPAPEQEVLL